MNLGPTTDPACDIDDAISRVGHRIRDDLRAKGWCRLDNGRYVEPGYAVEYIDEEAMAEALESLHAGKASFSAECRRALAIAIETMIDVEAKRLVTGRDDD